MTCQEIYLNTNIERMASLFSGRCCWNENDIANNKKMLKFETHDALNSVQKTMLKFDPVMHLKVQKNINKTFKNVEFLDFSNSDGLKKSLKNKDQYQLILIPFLGIMSVIDHEEQENILKILRDYIIPSGKLVFDVDIPDMQVMLCDPATTFFEHQIYNDQKSGSIIINTQRDYDEYTQTINLNIFVEFLDPSGAVDRKIMNQIFSRYTFRWEMYNLLLLCGYKSIDLYGDYEGNYFSENSHSMIWVSSF